MQLGPEHLAVALAAASIWCMGGVIFGIASLYPVLYYEGALEASSCGTDDACDARMDSQCCDAQQLKYTSITSVALFAADGAMLAYGEIGDRFGPRACFGTGAGLAWLGLFLLGLGARTGNDFLWLTSLLCIGVSGPGVFMGCLFLGERYPRLHAVISAVGAAMWDASALVFRLFALIYFGSVPSGGARPSFGLDAIAIVWLILVVPLGALTFSALPSKELLESLRAVAEPEHEGGAAVVDDNKVSFLSVFCRNDTRLMLCFMGLFNLKSSFYIATFAEQMRGLFLPSTAVSLADTFNIAFPVGGFFTSVVASILLDRLGKREDLYMTIVVLAAITFGACNLMPYAASQLASALLFGPCRTLQWACYFHFLSLPSRYPPQFVGRLLGYGNLVVALVGDVPISALNAFVLFAESLGSTEARYRLVHGGLQLGIIACLALPWYLHKQQQTSAAKSSSLF